LLAGQALDHLFASELFQVVGRLVSPVMGGRWPAEIPHLTSQFRGEEATDSGIRPRRFRQPNACAVY
jgi:hypothetical protein